jgi:molybdopterin-containing oxidoreductase family iron-sulfur binding subunit
MLDACPHHHEEDDASGALAAAADAALADIHLRAPGESKPAGKKVWRSLEELAGTKQFETMLHREFPHAASEWNDGPSRRNFLKLMSASLALAGLSACTLRKTEEKIVPYVDAPEDVIPGRPMFFATTMPFAGYGKGVVVESHEGRPTKIEGNADHPASLGSSDIWMQASVLEMYDPDRSQMVMQGTSPSTWGNFASVITKELDAAANGKGVRILTGAVTSPTLARQIKAFLARYPQAKWYQHEVVGRVNTKAGAMLAFGEDVDSIYQFKNANVIVSLDSNFLTDLPGSLAYSRDFIANRRIRQGDGEAKMNRLYVAETSISVTGAQADHRLAIKSGEIEALASDILAALGGQTLTGPHAKWATAVAADLKKNAGKSLVVVGESQPAAVHAIAHKINGDLGNVGITVTYIDPVPVPADSLEDLVAEMDASLVDILFIVGTNPSFTAPASMGLGEGLDAATADERKGDYSLKNPLGKVPLVVHHGLYGHDLNGGFTEETAVFAHWHIPASHYLESWGDLRAFDGTASIVQPLIYPLYTTKSEIEFVSFLAGDLRSAHDIVQETWTKVVGKLSDDDWQRSLEKGVVFGNTRFPAKTLALRPISATASTATTEPSESRSLEVVFKTDPTIYDGRYANNGWLQEVPKPISLLTWENVALMSVKTAADFQISQADQGKGVEVPRVDLKVDGRTLNIPALIMPGHADDSVTVYLGYGRKRCGRVGSHGVNPGYIEAYPGSVGADAYVLKPTTNTWFVSGVSLVPTEKLTAVATSQSHHLMDLPAQNKLDTNWIEGRELIQNFKLDEIKTGKVENDDNDENPPRKLTGKRTISLTLAKDEIPDNQKMLPAWNYDYNKWGMVIDNQACIGCNACVVACQSENNIAIVGKEEVLRGREMHWIRIDTYFLGEPDGSVEVYNQPIPCMQCENAPCELVCPVEATTTSAEGINEQTYNRCVGTRYCSNNCPYKVRRFNFLQYTDYDTPQFQLQRNPNVTVRARGIMEKCNFCVQRVNNGRIEAKKQDRPINPGDVVTACAQACPTQAITFGNLNDPRWEVTGLQNEPLRYTLLDELNALPRVSYLSRVRNPNPELV